MSRFDKFCILVVCIVSGFFAIASSGTQDFGVELLVYDTDHWTDELSGAERSLRKVQQIEYDQRDRRGDIIEIHEWPYWSQGLSVEMGKAFRVVVVKGITIQEARSMKWGQCNAIGRRAMRVANNKIVEIETINNLADISVRSN